MHYVSLVTIKIVGYLQHLYDINKTYEQNYRCLFFFRYHLMTINARLPAIKAERKVNTAIVGRLFTSASNCKTVYDRKSSSASLSFDVDLSSYPSYMKSIYPELFDV